MGPMLHVPTDKRRFVKLVIPICFFLMLASGSYLLYITFSPKLDYLTLDPSNNATTQALQTDDPKAAQLYIPKIDVNVGYYDDEAALDSGAWWRQPHNGNPKEGGNFILTAHRFVFGLLPGETSRQSPFYNIDRLELGDEIYVDYQYTRYTYKVSNIYRVKPADLEIEQYTDKPQLTLYSCVFGGESDGRDIVIATPATK
jgi:LPXTG-site transpeptidase (sortase) family protein